MSKFAAVPEPPDCLAECQYFRTERLSIESEITIEFPQTRWCICLEGMGHIDNVPYRAGQAFQLDAGFPTTIRPTTASVFLQTFVPASSSL